LLSLSFECETFNLELNEGDTRTIDLIADSIEGFNDNSQKILKASTQMKMAALRHEISFRANNTMIPK